MRNDPAVPTERPLLGALVERALAAGTPRAVAAEAVCVTSARFPRRSGAERASRTRVESYFWGVVRNRERELLEAGHTPEATRDEIVRLYGDSACDLFACGQVS